MLPGWALPRRWQPTQVLEVVLCGCERTASAEGLRQEGRGLEGGAWGGVWGGVPLQLEQGKEGAGEEEIPGTRGQCGVCTNGQHSNNINHFKCMNYQSNLSTAEFPKGHTVNLPICSRMPVLLATVRSDNEHTCRRFSAWDVTGFTHCLQEDLVCDQRRKMTWSHRPGPGDLPVSLLLPLDPQQGCQAGDICKP